MRSHIALIAVAVVVPLLGCGRGTPSDAPALVPTVGDSPSRKESAPPPRIWQDEDATNAIRVLGYPEAHVFRWQGNVPAGWVEFNGKAGPQRTQLDWLPTLARQAIERDDGGIPAKERFSGLVVVALKKKGKGEDADYDCSIGFCMTDKHGTSVNTLRVGPIQGQVRLKTADPNKLLTAMEVSSTFVRLNKDEDGRQVTWLELRLVEPGK